MSSWGEIIRQARKSKGLTQTELAEILGVSQPTIVAWEKHGPNKTKAEMRDRLGEVLGIQFANGSGS